MEKLKKQLLIKGEFPADMVVLCAGFRPNTDLGKDKLELLKMVHIQLIELKKQSLDDVMQQVIVQQYLIILLET